jgi:hypothetical protein
MGLRFNWKKNQIVSEAWKSTCEYVIEKKTLKMNRSEKTHFHFHAFLLNKF